MAISRSEASRINGSKSTGPVTPEGRAASSQNALNLGIFSKRQFLPEENPADFYALLDSLIDVYNPATAVEVIYVDRMAMARWYLARLERAEVAVIELQRNLFHFASEEDKWQRYGNRMLAQRINTLDQETRNKYINDRNAVITAALGFPEDPERFSRRAAALHREFDLAARHLREEQSRRVDTLERRPLVTRGAQDRSEAIEAATLEQA